MDQILETIGDTIGGFFANPIVQLAIQAVAIYFVILWLASAYWAFRDMQHRTENPILPYVDKVLYLVNGQFRVGKPDEVMNSVTLSELYRTKIEVIKVGGQIHVAGAQSALCEDESHHIELDERVS